MSNDADHAAAVERIARQLGDDQALARDALHLAAQLLRHAEGAAHYRLTQLLNHIETGELLAAASVRLELEAAAGNVDAGRAAAHVASAGIILYPGDGAP